MIFTWDEHMGRSVAASGELLRRPPVNGHHITAQDVSTVNEQLSSATNTARSNPDKDEVNGQVDSSGVTVLA